MKQQMKKAIIIITILALHSTLIDSLPVTSKALENNSDQLIWQTAWYSSHLTEGNKDNSPFTGGDSKKITAKSIFITPNFNQNESHCPPSYKIDDNGKCIKVVNVNPDDLLVTRLQNFFSQHQTTDDSTSLDYDYSTDEEERPEQPTHYDLPLIPIVNNNDTSIYTADEVSSTVQYEVEVSDYSFRDSNHTNHPETSTEIDSTDHRQIGDSNSTLINSPDITKRNETENEDDDEENVENSTAWYQRETPRVDENNVNIDQNDTTTEENLTEEQTEATSDDFSNLEDQFNEGENYTTTSSEFVINKSTTEEILEGTEKTISNGSDTMAMHLDDYFDTILLNDSLLIDDTSSRENVTLNDYDVTTTLDEDLAGTTINESEEEIVSELSVPSTSTTTTQSSPQNLFPYENRIIKDDEQNSDEEANKFVYHHLAATESFSEVLPTPTIVRFPPTEQTSHRVRFPDEPRSPSFSWPRDNGGLMRFWQDQPLINDFKIFSRGHSTGTGGNFHRHMSYRRNF